MIVATPPRQPCHDNQLASALLRVRNKHLGHRAEHRRGQEGLNVDPFLAQLAGDAFKLALSFGLLHQRHSSRWRRLQHAQEEERKLPLACHRDGIWQRSSSERRSVKWNEYQTRHSTPPLGPQCRQRTLRNWLLKVNRACPAKRVQNKASPARHRSLTQHNLNIRLGARRCQRAMEKGSFGAVDRATG